MIYYFSVNMFDSILKIISFAKQGHSDVNIKGKNGQTPLHIATEKCNIDIVKYLIEQ
jgi:ankyrin repeat protein